jgi:hypothetical protein
MSLLVDRKVLQSQYSRNNLNIHFKLVSLYVTNLNSLATTSALIAGLSFGCIHEFDYPTKFISTSWRFGYFYSLVSMLALVFAILALSQTTICVIFGPTMFLFGENHSDSLSALQIMKQQQKEGFFWSCACVAMAFLQTLFFEWGVTHFPLACILTVVHLCGYYVIYKQGQKTMKELVPLPTQSSSTQESASSNVSVMTGNGHHPTLKDLIKGSLMGHGPIGEPDQSGLTLESAPSAASNFSKAEDIRNVSPPPPLPLPPVSLTWTSRSTFFRSGGEGISGRRMPTGAINPITSFGSMSSWRAANSLSIESERSLPPPRLSSSLR